ncbi:MAG TPA: hypothetical protein VGN97_08460 [Mesorhizobium sp.]|jgi:hypothetical protein|nr:hypothetical protein [Mesorhizobium sp.]
MTDRAKRLEKLLGVHQTLEALGEARRAGLAAEARRRREEARHLAERLDDPQSLSTLFPALFHDRIQKCLAGAQDAEAAAAREAEMLARLRLRTENIRRARDEEQAGDERRKAERLVLDWVEARQAAASSAKHNGG